jgi:hypothetical protein
MPNRHQWTILHSNRGSQYASVPNAERLPRLAERSPSSAEVGSTLQPALSSKQAE